ncbi:hypothetical protein GVN18_43610 [Pseudomonas sp. ODNR1LW]|nr:hypothetical protein [Pseudomonas sp. ODNR1LW]
MKRLLTAVLAASTGWAFATAVAAEPFETFLDLCFANSAQVQAVDAAAKRAGWSAAPEELRAALAEEFRDPIAYLNTPIEQLHDADALEIVVAGSGDGETVMGVSGLRVDLCMIVNTVDNSETLKNQFKNLIGLAPTDIKDEQMQGWLFSRSPSGFASEAALLEMDDAEAVKAVRRKPLYLAFVVAEDGFSGLAFAVVKSAD